MDEKKYTFENKEYRDTYRHSTSHILAQAVKRLYPEAKLAIGPSIEDGFYYDIDSEVTFTPRGAREDRGRDAQDLQGKAAHRAL